MDKHDFYWLTGILEGEGTFLAAPPSSPGIPAVRVSMTDRDVVERVGRIWARAVVPLPRPEQRYKVAFVTTIKGSSAVQLMTLARPHLSSARQAQIDNAVRSWHPMRRRRPSAELKADTDADDAALLAVWLAGLFEGEGMFTIARTRGHAYPVLSVEMCDEEIVLRAAHVLQARAVERRESRHDGWRPTFLVRVSGKAAAEWMARLRPLMGERRAAEIDAALAAYEPVRLVDPPSCCVVAGCGAPHRSRGLCHKHYMTWMRDVARGRTPRVTALRS